MSTILTPEPSARYHREAARACKICLAFHPAARRAADDRSAKPLSSVGVVGDMPSVEAAISTAEESPHGSSEVAGLVARHLALWSQSPESPPRLGAPVRRSVQRRNRRAADRLMGDVAARLEDYPSDAEGQGSWREELRERIQGFGERCLGWPADYRRMLLGDDFFQTSVDFARTARAFDPEVSLDDLHQALRNVWIANSLQGLLDLPTSLTPAVFAYSMIYPYSDNTLDDPSLPAGRKRRSCERLGARLEGERVAPIDATQSQVFRLLERIEEQYPRPSHPGVYASLLAIHRGQLHSLAQQGRRLSEPRALGISVEKGGASVLADGYLVAGRLDRDEADFCFGYGVALQLLDDLQDARRDAVAGHWTLFSRLVGAETLDGPASRLYHYMRTAIDGADRFREPRYRPLRDLIFRNCSWLFVAAVVEHEALFSRQLVAHLEAHWPFRFASLRRLRRRSEKRLQRALAVLRRTRGAGSLLELLTAPG